MVKLTCQLMDLLKEANFEDSEGVRYWLVRGAPSLREIPPNSGHLPRGSLSDIADYGGSKAGLSLAKVAVSLPGVFLSKESSPTLRCLRLLPGWGMRLGDSGFLSQSL